MNLVSTFLFMYKEHPNPIGITLENLDLVNILQTCFSNKKVKNIDLVNILQTCVIVECIETTFILVLTLTVMLYLNQEVFCFPVLENQNYEHCCDEMYYCKHAWHAGRPNCHILYLE